MPDGGLIFHLLLIIGTIMVIFFDRCVTALMLQKMPWNKNRQARLC